MVVTAPEGTLPLVVVIVGTLSLHAEPRSNSSLEASMLPAFASFRLTVVVVLVPSWLT